MSPVNKDDTEFTAEEIVFLANILGKISVKQAMEMDFSPPEWNLIEAIFRRKNEVSL